MEQVRILYIDDDAGIGRLVERALAPHGISVRHVGSGDEGLELLEKERFHAIALDHNLTNETGLDVLSKIQRVTVDVPVVYVTGSEDARVAVAALKAGAADYVWKDVQGHFRELLGAAIRSALQQQRMKAEAEEAQRTIREERDRAELLLHEVNHRVANSLALVASLARLQANAVQDEAARHALQEMQARIMAVAGIHRRLYTSSDVRIVELGSYLMSLIDELSAAIDAADKKNVVALHADADVRVPTDKAVSIGVIVTELLTNAYKYAYPAGMRGEIRVILQKIGDDTISIAVEDDGVGWKGTGSTQGTGLGTRVITAMAANLQSKVEYDSGVEGTRASFRFRL
ncbi:histidine kinase dimerization/phosphoacceptor domain -containing protein [uncultured Reyranella sp.]|uniref:sensor histidine kinase n=1 Tax=uncultured Reyranella sp. TaxID=735512 RepID=UPI0025EF9FEF|nr:histidine kinase dimerization/phosphoacceptor domain -containing protein [uncultured Reyranella sp.]